MKKPFFVASAFFAFLLASVMLSGGQKVLAAPSVDACHPYETSWKVSIFKAIDFQKTWDDAFTAIANSFFGKIFGANPNDAVACEDGVLGSLSKANGVGLNRGSGVGFGNTTKCTADTDQVNKCGEITNVIKTAYMYDGKPTELLAIDNSLFGFSNRVQNVVLRDPVAVNLAYFWRDQVARVPFVGKTYAATLGSNSNAIINASLSVWKAVRNVSLGFIAVILMYTGIMIIMRKKVNPQLVVTVQYAIPKIIIGLILILFSYPIGAAITGLSWGLFRSANDIIAGAMATGLTGADFAGTVLLALVIGSLKMGFFASIGMALVILVALASAIMLVIVNIKALIIYIKMVFSTITAPFEFALGTVPGSEGRIGDWFKRMAKYGLTIFAMGAIVPATLWIALQVLLYYSFNCNIGGTCPVEVAGMGTLMMVVAPLIIIILGFSLAFGMEGKMDTMFFGGKPKR